MVLVIRGIWVVLLVCPHAPARVTSVVVDDGVLAGISQQAPWFVTLWTAANRHRVRERDRMPSVART